MKTLVVEYWLPLLVWLLAIFFFSTESLSSGETSRFIGPLLAFFFPGLSPGKIELVHVVIRKCAHLTEYFILAMLAYRSISHEDSHPIRVTLRAGALVLLVALLDEFHQSLVPSRTASIVDVGYDSLGGVWALWCITTYETWRLRSHPVL